MSSQGSPSSLFGTTQLTGNARANSISPEHLQSLSDVNVSQQDEFSLITPAQRGQDKILRSSQRSQDKNIGFDMSATISGVTSGDNLPATFNGSQPTQPGRGGGLGGPRHSHLARPASLPSQGGSGARSRQGDSGRIRLGCSELKYSLVLSFFHSTGPPHEWFRIFRAYERPGVASCENSSNHVTHKRRPAEFEIRLEQPAGFDVRLERSIKHVS